jgi:hypothetical protein
MIEGVVSSITIFDNLWKAGRYAVGLGKEAYQDVKNKEAYIQASREYYNKFSSRHGQIKVLPEHMGAPRTLSSVYTATQLTDKKDTYHFTTPDNLAHTYRMSGKRSFQFKCASYDGMTIAKDRPRLMVLGEPGVGKSTFLKMLGLEAFKGEDGQLESSQIPVLIELKTFRDREVDIRAAVIKEFEVCGFPNAVEMANSTLRDGKLLILLDGLDETPARNMTQVIEHIENFATQYSRNHFVASCRTAAYRSMSFKNFVDTTVTSFNEQQIKQFVSHWFSSELDKSADIANRFWSLLKRPENVAAKELAQTPLLLTFLCLIYDNNGVLPDTRSILYDEALDIVLNRWTAQNRIERDPIYEGFHSVLEKEFLSEIAFSHFEEDRLFLLQSDIVESITAFLTDTLGVSEHLNGEAVLTAIEVQQGILAKRAVNTYSFSHLTLHEYLTALYIVNNHLTEELVSRHLLDRRWREVFILVTGLLSRRGLNLLEMLEEHSRTHIDNHPKLHKLLQWSGQITQNAPGQFKDYEKRAAVLHIVIEGSRNRSQDGNKSVNLLIDSAISNAADSALAVSDRLGSAFDKTLESDIAEDIFENNDHAIICYGAIDRAFEQAISIDKLSYLIDAQALKLPAQDVFLSHVRELKSKLPTRHASHEDWNHYAHELESLLIEILEVTPEMLSLTQEEWQALEDYIYSNELLLRCRQSAIGISLRAWEQLEKRLMSML